VLARCRASFALMGADWQRLRYGIDKPSKMGRPAQRDTQMLFLLLMPWIVFNVFTSSPLLARNETTSWLIL